jgi:hypothetical protein
MTKPRYAIFTMLVKNLLTNCKNFSACTNGMLSCFFKMPRTYPNDIYTSWGI